MNLTIAKTMAMTMAMDGFSVNTAAEETSNRVARKGE